ncbi:MAG TPA: hypothetical protein VD735_01335 [Candidatus Saccharimonadales bacterium]|nr:hypothetical protein [Candidatus Saccharimonadales bacterium]
MNTAPHSEAPKPKRRRYAIPLAAAAATLVAGGSIATFRGGGNEITPPPAPSPSATGEALPSPAQSAAGETAPATTSAAGEAACRRLVDIIVTNKSDVEMPSGSPLAQQVRRGINLTYGSRLAAEAVTRNPQADQIGASLERISDPEIHDKASQAAVLGTMGELANKAGYNNELSEEEGDLTADLANANAVVAIAGASTSSYRAEVDKIAELDKRSDTATTDQLFTMSFGYDKQATDVGVSMLNERQAVLSELCDPYPEQMNRVPRR